MRIEIISPRCNWGMAVAQRQDGLAHEAWKNVVCREVTRRCPDASWSHRIEWDAFDGAPKITVYPHPDDPMDAVTVAHCEDVRDEIREILERSLKEVLRRWDEVTSE